MIPDDHGKVIEKTCMNCMVPYMINLVGKHGNNSLTLTAEIMLELTVFRDLKQESVDFQIKNE